LKRGEVQLFHCEEEAEEEEKKKKKKRGRRFLCTWR
jgi:hypothetical protein